MTLKVTVLARMEQRQDEFNKALNTIKEPVLTEGRVLSYFIKIFSYLNPRDEFNGALYFNEYINCCLCHRLGLRVQRIVSI
ncbi:hypothetical protein [Borrelia sp. P9F1]|uniref:hypothetical protein n=1 Tax=Borrelia sp. P9F1 TaxID=3058374 RepID=UPI00264761DB|nr:hypothetical protein [Borrelia sp. P9F1]WKC58503.1 hypothetical protein QYZ68_04810 [Borrelia sp. P9F1]